MVRFLPQLPTKASELTSLLCTAKCFGLRVIGIDSTAKEKTVRASGAEHFVDFTKTQNVVEEVVKLSGGGAHHSVICVAHSGGYTDALKYARVFGKIAAVGLTKFSCVVLSFSCANLFLTFFSPILFRTHSALLIEKQLTLVGTHVGTPNDCVEALSFVGRGLVKCEIVERPFSGEVIEETFEEMHKGTIVGRVVMSFE